MLRESIVKVYRSFQIEFEISDNSWVVVKETAADVGGMAENNIINIELQRYYVNAFLQQISKISECPHNGRNLYK